MAIELSVVAHRYIVQQLMDSIGPVQEELRRLQGLHEQLQLGGAVEQAISTVRECDELLQRAVSPTLARDLLDRVMISQSVFESAASLMPNPDLLQAAIQPANHQWAPWSAAGRECRCPHQHPARDRMRPDTARLRHAAGFGLLTGTPRRARV